MPAIVVTARDSRITDSQRRYVEEKLAGLGKYFDGINKIEAVVEQSGTRTEVSSVPRFCRLPGVPDFGLNSRH